MLGMVREVTGRGSLTSKPSISMEQKDHIILIQLDTDKYMSGVWSTILINGFDDEWRFFDDSIPEGTILHMGGNRRTSIYRILKKGDIIIIKNGKYLL